MGGRNPGEAAGRREPYGSRYLEAKEVALRVLPTELRDGDTADCTRTGSREIPPGDRFESKSRRAEKGGRSLRPAGGLPRNNHVHRLPMGDAACG